MCWEDGAPQRPLVLWLCTGVQVEMPVGLLGLGLLQEAETQGDKDTFPEEKVVSSTDSWSVVTGPRNDQRADKHSFLCQSCIIRLREIVLPELSEPLSYR